MTRETQCGRLLDLLRSNGDFWTPLPLILDLRIAKYSSRLTELRKRGYVIENQKETVDGICHSRYRLLAEPQEIR